MLILIDYENIPLSYRRLGIDFIVDKIIRTIGSLEGVALHRAQVRLYGGWYKLNKPTRLAQDLAIKVQASFPKPVIVEQINNKRVIATIAVELAYSLAIDPSTHLWHTYRPRSLPPNLVCVHPRTVGCRKPNCPLETVYRFFHTESCPDSSCTITPTDILHRPEQKLVDTMITSDMIFYASNKKEPLCVVTSDDDLWPGIVSALYLGAVVYQIHTHSSRKTPFYYTRNTSSKYKQISL